MNLLPYPQSLRRLAGHFLLPTRAVLCLPLELPRELALLRLAERIREVARTAGAELEIVFTAERVLQIKPAGRRSTALGAPASLLAGRDLASLELAGRDTSTPAPHAGGYTLHISKTGVLACYHDVAGLHHAIATLRQLIREYGRRLPCLVIRDWPDFPHRGVMLDISRGRVPRIETLLELAETLADFKINELQLYVEHTFAYRDFKPVWRDWGAITGREIRRLDARCRELGIELVPNQNSFGHLREWLQYPPLRKLAEVKQPYETPGAGFLRHPSTLAPRHPGTLPFLRRLYDELLPNFTSGRFNIGCDETWDLGRGQSRALCVRRGKGRVYLDFLLRLRRELRLRGKQTMFWGDIVLHHPELIPQLPDQMIALNWGYEADHPFEREAAAFAEAGVPFYVCPGTSTWMTMIGRHDNAFSNLRSAAAAGRTNGAIGFLNTDWGDGGHPQPLGVSWPLYVVGAALSWNSERFDEKQLAPVLNRDVFDDPTGRTAEAALGLGFAHQKFAYREPNATPFGAVIAAPPPALREIFCRNGLKYYARIDARCIHTAHEAVAAQRRVLRRGSPQSNRGKLLSTELDLAARMAEQSCEFMIWQQALAGGRVAESRRRARKGVVALNALAEDFDSFWPVRNKETALRHWPFLKWRLQDYKSNRLHFTPNQARIPTTLTP